MCTFFHTDISSFELEKLYEAEAFETPSDLTSQEQISPYSTALTVVRINCQIQLKPMRFSLTPSWSKTEKTDFASHNAKIETIGDKPAWKKPFQRRRCIIPMTDFIEPSYWGKLAGNMVRIYRSDQRIFSAAAIFDLWKAPDSDSTLYSFALLTQPSGRYVDECGHERQPVFIKEQAADAWLNENESDIEKLKDILRKNLDKPDFQTGIVRQMKPGWEKRREHHMAKRNRRFI